jgi:hypothetical protein
MAHHIILIYLMQATVVELEWAVSGQAGMVRPLVLQRRAMK